MSKRNRLLKQSGYYIIGAIFIFAIACCSTNQSQNKSKPKRNKQVIKAFAIINPAKSEVFRLNDTVPLRLHHNDNVEPDSIHLYHNSERIDLRKSGLNRYSFLATGPLVGNQSYKINLFYSDSLKESHTFKVFLLPNETPKEIRYTTIRKFNHDPGAYTQGLLYRNGYLYESTGKKKHSSIRRINVETGEIVRKKSIDPEFFGEGIAVVGKEIYMITYISQVGFVFDAVTFDLIRKFDLQTREGWGLTTYKEQLVMSDGTPNLYFFDPQYFSLKKQMEVCDNKGLVSQLNELEFTKYGLFSNVYGQKHIVLIDIESGIVKGMLDLSGLFPKDIPDDYEHVLNGIAYNPDSDSFYVTGKQWPVIYEIKLYID